MADRFRNLVTELTTEFSAKKAVLEEQEQRLAAERQRLEQEKDLMTKVPVSDRDIIHLNVGGTHFATKRGSLRLVREFCGWLGMCVCAVSWECAGIDV